MHPDQYTNDAICRAMGIDGFADFSWNEVNTAIRILLKPSFSPEVCLTLRQDTIRSSLSIVALSEMFWQQPCPCRLLEYREQVALDRGLFDDCRREVEETCAREERPNRVVWIDGMEISCCINFSGTTIHFGDYRLIGRESFLSLLLTEAWNSSSKPEVKNILRECGRYMGLILPEQDLPERVEKLRIMVLGVPTQKADFFRVLSNVASRVPEAPNSSRSTPLPE